MDKHPRITCAQDVSLLQTEPLSLFPLLHPAMMFQSSAPRLTESPLPSGCVETPAVLRCHTIPLP